MAAKTKTSNAGKSRIRWNHGGVLARSVMPTLPSSSHVAVLWTCWFHSELTTDGSEIFDLTKKQIGDMCGIKERRVADILRELELANVIATRKDGCNSGGRSLGSERKITLEPWTETMH